MSENKPQRAERDSGTGECACSQQSDITRNELRIAAKVMRALHASVMSEPWWKRLQYNSDVIANLALSFDRGADEMDANAGGEFRRDSDVNSTALLEGESKCTL